MSVLSCHCHVYRIKSHGRNILTIPVHSFYNSCFFSHSIFSLWYFLCLHDPMNEHSCSQIFRRTRLRFLCEPYLVRTSISQLYAYKPRNFFARATRPNAIAGFPCGPPRRINLHDFWDLVGPEFLPKPPANLTVLQIQTRWFPHIAQASS